MIQRIQTVLLFVAAAVMIAMLFFPIWQKINESATEMAIMNAFSLDYKQLDDSGDMLTVASRDTFYIAGLALVSALIAIFSIFQYGSRLLQIKLGALNSFVLLAIMLTNVYFILKSEAALAPNLQGTYLIGFYFPVVALLCNMMANRFIRRDEQLVRSADRIR